MEDNFDAKLSYASDLKYQRILANTIRETLPQVLEAKDEEMYYQREEEKYSEKSWKLFT